MNSNNNCIICLEPVSYQLLACGHYFHRNCILEYYEYNNKKKCCVCFKRYTITDMYNINNDKYIKLKQFFNILPIIRDIYSIALEREPITCIYIIDKILKIIFIVGITIMIPLFCYAFYLICIEIKKPYKN